MEAKDSVREARAYINTIANEGIIGSKEHKALVQHLMATTSQQQLKKVLRENEYIQASEGIEAAKKHLATAKKTYGEELTWGGFEAKHVFKMRS